MIQQPPRLPTPQDSGRQNAERLASPNITSLMLGSIQPTPGPPGLQASGNSAAQPSTIWGKSMSDDCQEHCSKARSKFNHRPVVKCGLFLCRRPQQHQSWHQQTRRLTDLQEIHCLCLTMGTFRCTRPRWTQHTLPRRVGKVQGVSEEQRSPSTTWNWTKCARSACKTHMKVKGCAGSYADTCSTMHVGRRPWRQDQQGIKREWLLAQTAAAEAT